MKKKYLELDAEEKKRCFFFQRFQMNLYVNFDHEKYDIIQNFHFIFVTYYSIYMYVVSKSWFSFQRLSSDTKILDVKGKDLPAVDIVSYAIKYLIYHMLNEHKT